MLGEILRAAGSIAGGILGNRQRNQEASRQREFAQHGIQWRVRDAERAGIHPLYALGANTTSYSPQSVGDSGLASAGQNIGRAVTAAASQAERPDLFTRAAAEVQLEGLKLDNDLKRAQIASSVATLNQPGTPPGSPGANTRWMLDGQGNSPSVDDPNIRLQTNRDVREPGAPHSVAGAGPSVGFVRTPNGGYEAVIPPALAESYEQDEFGSLLWQLRNRILPNLGVGEKPNIPHDPDTETVFWNIRRQQWEVGPKASGRPAFRR